MEKFDLINLNTSEWNTNFEVIKIEITTFKEAVDKTSSNPKIHNGVPINSLSEQ